MSRVLPILFNTDMVRAMSCMSEKRGKSVAEILYIAL